jgi:HTH-type transcriptional regulator/antitoxin HigA
VNGNAPISHEFAIDLERTLGVPASLWNSLESTYRDLLARQIEAEQMEQNTEWASVFPSRRLQDEGLIAREAPATERPGQLLEFFGVASPDAWRQYWTSPRRLAARATGAYAADLPALTTWLRLGELAARDVEAKAFHAGRFATIVHEARGLTRESPAMAFSQVQDSAADAGVVVVLVKELPKIRCHGVTRWLSDDKALIQLCLRYKTADQLWFSFFHEACHVLKHSKKRTYIQDLADLSVEEMEANSYAADTLISPLAWRGFISAGRPTAAAVTAFAAEQGISPGIVVGRLQHEGIVPFNRLNTLKVKVDWALADARKLAALVPDGEDTTASIRRDRDTDYGRRG